MGRWTQRARELAARRADGMPDTTDRIHGTDDTGLVSSEQARSVEVAWRVAGFRATLPASGPIWPPKLCTIPQTDMPGRCGLCGEVLPSNPAPRFSRCQPCVQALEVALNATREDVVPAIDDGTMRKPPDETHQ